MTDRAIVQDAVSAGIVPAEATLGVVIDASASGDDRARDLLDARAAELGRACATLVDFAGPGLLVVAGLATTAPGYRDVFEKEFRIASGQPLGTPVAISTFGDFAPTVASAAFILDAFIRNPLAFEATVKEVGLH